jgi:CrcB protein
MNIMPWILVALGGALGATIRYGACLWIDGKIAPPTEGWGSHLPGAWGTWLVNVAGCLLIGLVASALGDRAFEDERIRAFLIVGVFGGFTTMSALGLEGWNLFRDGQLVKGLALAMIQALVCLLMVGLGSLAGKLLRFS